MKKEKRFKRETQPIRIGIDSYNRMVQESRNCGMTIMDFHSALLSGWEGIGFQAKVRAMEDAGRRKIAEVSQLAVTKYTKRSSKK